MTNPNTNMNPKKNIRAYYTQEDPKMTRAVSILAKCSVYDRHEAVRIVNGGQCLSMSNSVSGEVIVVYSPGNGSQYKMLFQRMHNNISRAMGAPSNAWMVTDLWHSRRFVVAAEGQLVHLNYVREKLELEHPAVQTAMINIVVGGRNGAWEPEQYGRDLLAELVR